MPTLTPVSRVGSHHANLRWDQQKAVSELERPKPELLFVCGSSRDRDRFLPYFTKIFNLRIDDDTMRRRLQERTDDDWPLGQEGVELMLSLNRSDEKPAGAIDVDAPSLWTRWSTNCFAWQIRQALAVVGRALI